MNDFAVLDDSVVYEGNVYVYAHALIVADELPQVRVFTGDRTSIYDASNRSELKRFLKEHVPHGCILYVCDHYNTHHRDIVQKLHAQTISGDLPKEVQQYFIQAHHTARTTARIELEKIISKNPKHRRGAGSEDIESRVVPQN